MFGILPVSRWASYEIIPDVAVYPHLLLHNQYPGQLRIDIKGGDVFRMRN
jgi:hypothetical protein